MLRIHPGCPGAIKTTARRLIYARLGNRPLGQAAVNLAILEMRCKGWLANYVPGPFEFDRTIVFIPEHHPFEAIFRCLDWTGSAVVPRGLIESRTDRRLTNPTTGMWLATYGLAIVAVEGCNVHLRGASGGMAGRVNRARYGDMRRALCTHLVENATGLVLPKERLNEDLRLRAALVFEQFQVDVPGLLDGLSRSPVVPRWRFPDEQYDPSDVPF